MLPKGHYFPGQEMSEEIVLFIRRHWVSFLARIIILLLLGIAPILIIISWNQFVGEIYSASSRNYLIIGLSAWYLIILAAFIISWISFYLNVLIITNQRLVDIEQYGLFNRKISEQSLLRVQDVSAKMIGFFQTFFNYGSVFVETAGDIPNFEINSIPNPNRIANTILKLHEKLVQSSHLESQMAEGEGIESSPNYYTAKPELKPKIDESISAKNSEGSKKEEKIEKIEKNEDAVVSKQKDYQENTPQINNQIEIKEEPKIVTNLRTNNDSKKTTSEFSNNRLDPTFKNDNQFKKAEGDLKEGEVITFDQ